MRADHTPDESNTRSPYTTFKWKRVIITGPPAPKAQRAAGARPAPLGTRDPRKPITVSVEYRGGPEAKWRIRARGRTWNVSGVTSIHDVMAMINVTLDRPDR